MLKHLNQEPETGKFVLKRDIERGFRTVVRLSRDGLPHGVATKSFFSSLLRKACTESGKVNNRKLHDGPPD